MIDHADFTPTDKAQLKNVLIAALTEELNLARIAADEAKSSATSPEAKSENKYDTRSTEAAYLAHGQSLRAQSLWDLITQIQNWTPPESQTHIQLGALLCLRSKRDQRPDRWIWITPIGARHIELRGTPVQLVNHSAPLAQQLIGLEIGDSLAVMNEEWVIAKAI